MTSTELLHGKQRAAILIAALLALVFFAGKATAMELVAKVDRAVISEDETLELTVRVNERVGYNSPDFGGLEENFDILSQQRSSQFRSINGRTEAWTDWTLVLAPKQSGTLSIPSFSFQGAMSDPLQVTVNEARTSSGEARQEIFVEVETDKPDVFVQEQLLVTIRIHTGVMLRDATMEKDLSVENAMVESVSETAYNKEIDGQPYRVMELVYAVYPQKSEPITIPSLRWNLVMATNRGSGLRYRFQTPGQVRRLRSEPLTVPVKSRSSEFTGDHWLPASDVTLEEHWSSDPSRFVIGEPLTRTITLRAEGQTSAQLPELPDQKIDGIKVYSDQPQFDDVESADGVTGNRIESVAIVPTKAGELTLPEMRVRWWDTEAQQERVATLPERVINVTPAAADDSVRPLAPPGDEATDGRGQDGERSEREREGAGAGPSQIWLLLSNGVFAALALFFMLAWLRSRNRLAPATGKDNTEAASELDEAFHAVRRACSENDARAARNALGEWGRLYWQLPRSTSLQQITARSDYEPLAKELAELDKILYGSGPSAQETDSHWRGDQLWRALVKFKRKDKKKRQEQQGANEEQLPPLYPTNE